MKRLLTLLWDDRGGEVTAQAAVYTAAFVLCVAYLRRWQDVLGLLVLGTAKNDTLLFERNFARDRYAFRAPVGGKEVEKWPERGVQNHRREWYDEAQLWQWRGDEQTRVFVIPVELAGSLAHMHFVRDVLAAVTTLYITSKTRGQGRTVVTTMRELCRLVGVAANGEVCDKIQSCLTILRSLTIKRQRVPTKVKMVGKRKIACEWGTAIFGFVERAVIVDTRLRGSKHEPIPLRERRIEITLSTDYTDFLNKAATCVVPVAALIAARKLNRRQIAQAKNIVYYLAARSGHQARLRWETLAEIAGLRGRWPGERRGTSKNLLTAMVRAGIVSFSEDEDGECVTITLSGSGGGKPAKPSEGEEL